MRIGEFAASYGLTSDAVIDELKRMGERSFARNQQLPGAVVRKLREAIGASRPSRDPSRARPQILAAQPLWQMREDYEGSVESAIPVILERLRRVLLPPPSEYVVVFHDSEAPRRYGIATLDGRPLPGAKHFNMRELLSPLIDAGQPYIDRQLTPPNHFIAFDLSGGAIYKSHKLKTVRHLVEMAEAPVEHLPPHLNDRATEVDPKQAAALADALGRGTDRPEETFLLDLDFLHLAVDTLEDAELLDPLPVHTNALWVFARPVVMQRPDGRERYARAIWFRQGQAAWRLRTYVVSGQMELKDTRQLSGRIPFIPIWDETRPEQKVLAAVWALISQDGVTESERHEPAPTSGAGPRPRSEGDLTVVRLKAGTDHARAYSRQDSDPDPNRPAWSVRGHWRHQPYPSLGLDEEGHVRTKPIWIATYTKGNPAAGEPKRKVIAVE